MEKAINISRIIDVSDRDQLMESGDYKPVVNKMLYWYSYVYNLDAGGSVPEPFIGKIVGTAQKNLKELSSPKNQERVDRLDRILWELIPNKHVFKVSKSDNNVFVDLKNNRSMVTTLKNFAIDDRGRSNRLPRIWLLYNQGVLDWLLNSAEGNIFDRFINEVLEGSINQHFISKEEVSRVDDRRKGNLKIIPAIGKFIGALKSGKSYDVANGIVNETYDKEEVFDNYYSKSKPNYRMSKIDFK